MKIKMVTFALIAGFASLSAQADFNQFHTVDGVIDFWDASGSSYIGTMSPFGLADVRSITTDNLTFEVLPNINLYGDGTDPVWADGANGNSTLHAHTVWAMGPGLTHELTADITAVDFDINVDAFALTGPYTLEAFAKVLDPGAGYSESVIDIASITGTGPQSLSINTSGLGGQLLQVGWTLTGLNQPPANANTYGSATLTAISLDATSSDFTAPTAVFFETPPTTDSDSQISMMASLSVDNYYDVEYMFVNNTTATSSGWQSSRNYTETGLASGTLYSYQVKARDTGINANETALSTSGSAITSAIDLTPPTPATMSFDSTDVGTSMIELTAVTATDGSGVEYYFECTSGGTNDSGWVDGNVWIATGLTPGSSYAYTVIARDKAAAQNSNTVSAPVNLTTLSATSGSFTNTLKSFTGNTQNPNVLLELNKLGFETGSIHPSAIIAFDGTGATCGDNQGFAARNVFRTVADGYANKSVEVYATLTFAGQGDLSGYIGIGQGIQTGVSGSNWGVPELSLMGVNGCLAQFKDNTAGGTPLCSIMKTIDGWPAPVNGGSETFTPAIGSTETIRARLIYDVTTDTVNIAYDKNYTGGAFTVDQDMGTVSTLNSLTSISMFAGAPTRIYVGGGEGTLVSDFEVVVTYEQIDPQPPYVVAADIAAGQTILTWPGTAGRTYDVEYKTSLTDLTWTTDPSPGASDIISTGGPHSATSTVDAASVYYQILSK